MSWPGNFQFRLNFGTKLRPRGVVFFVLISPVWESGQGLNFGVVKEITSIEERVTQFRGRGRFKIEAPVFFSST